MKASDNVGAEWRSNSHALCCYHLITTLTSLAENIEDICIHNQEGYNYDHNMLYIDL